MKFSLVVILVSTFFSYMAIAKTGGSVLETTMANTNITSPSRGDYSPMPPAEDGPNIGDYGTTPDPNDEVEVTPGKGKLPFPEVLISICQQLRRLCGTPLGIAAARAKAIADCNKKFPNNWLARQACILAVRNAPARIIVAECQKQVSSLAICQSGDAQNENENVDKPEVEG